MTAKEYIAMLRNRLENDNTYVWDESIADERIRERFEEEIEKAFKDHYKK